VIPAADALRAKRLLDAGFAAEAFRILEPICSEPAAGVLSWLWLADAQRLLGRRSEAASTLDEALALSPGDADLAVARSEIALGDGDLEQAEQVLRGAAAGDSAVLEQLGRVALASRRYDEALSFLRLSVAANPISYTAQSALIVATTLAGDMDTAKLKSVQRSWHGPAAQAVRWPDEQFAPRRKLRIGYVSRAFNYNNVAKVIAPVVLRHDRERFDVTLYSTSRVRDGASVRFRQAADHWRAIAGLSDVEAAEQVRRDRIDILVDIDGHFFANRLGIFSLRAAPVQVSAWGYVPGPGIAGIDALLTDATIALAGEDDLFPEQLLRLSRSEPYDLSFRPGGEDLWPRAPGPLRFGSFHRSDKLNDNTLSLWAQVLAACPGATLTLKCKFLISPDVQSSVRRIFERRGVDSSRLIFEGNEPHADYLAAFDRIDTALDPTPVNAGLVTLDGLSRGVPAITLTGRGPQGRLGTSILRRLGLGRFICATEDQYVATAAAIHRQPEQLAALRQEIRREALNAYGEDSNRAYAGEVEQAYLALWERVRL
jgi:predicted O-linked N-acetylglucosamine transferase (SPINDLY family)